MFFGYLVDNLSLKAWLNQPPKIPENSGVMGVFFHIYFTDLHEIVKLSFESPTRLQTPPENSQIIDGRNIQNTRDDQDFRIEKSPFLGIYLDSWGILRGFLKVWGHPRVGITMRFSYDSQLPPPLRPRAVLRVFFWRLIIGLVSHLVVSHPDPERNDPAKPPNESPT